MPSSKVAPKAASNGKSSKKPGQKQAWTPENSAQRTNGKKGTKEGRGGTQLYIEHLNEEKNRKGKDKVSGKLASDAYMKKQERKEKRRAKEQRMREDSKPTLKKDMKKEEKNVSQVAAAEEPAHEDSDSAPVVFTCKTTFFFFKKEETIPSGIVSAAVRRLGLTSSQIGKIYRCFRKIDEDGSGQIDMPEFFKMIDTLDTPFMRTLVDKMVFDMVDIDNDGQLDFNEFLLASALVCSFSKDELLGFIFETFDEDNSGIISVDELKNLVDAILTMGSALFPSDFMSVMNSFDANNDGGIDYGEFLTMSKKYPVIFFPAMRMQDTFQRKTLGDTWIRIEERYHKKEYDRVSGDVSRMMSLRANLNADFKKKR